VDAERVLWPMCVFGCISVVVVDGVCVRYCRGLGLCTVGTVGYSGDGKCVGGRGSVLIGWGKIAGRCEGKGKSG
jgi:hypothetical protein